MESKLKLKLVKSKSKSQSEQLQALEKGIKDLLRLFDCTICTSVLVKPTETPCGHIFCGHCAEEICKRGTLHNSAKCPLCKAKISRRSLVVREDIHDLWIQANRIEEAYNMDIEINRSRHGEKLEDEDETIIPIIDLSPCPSGKVPEDGETRDTLQQQQDVNNSNYVDPFQEKCDSDSDNEMQVGESRSRGDGENKNNNPDPQFSEVKPNGADKTRIGSQRQFYNPHYIIMTSSLVPAVEPVAGSSKNKDVQVTSGPLDLSVQHGPVDYVPGYFHTAIKFIKPLDLSTKGEKRKLDKYLGTQPRNEDSLVNPANQLKKPRVESKDDVFKVPRVNILDLRKDRNEEIAKIHVKNSESSPVKVSNNNNVAKDIPNSTATNEMLKINTTLTPSSRLNIEKVNRKSSAQNLNKNSTLLKSNSSSRKDDFNIDHFRTNQQELQEHNNNQYTCEPGISGKSTNNKIHALNITLGEKGKEVTAPKLENSLTHKNKVGPNKNVSKRTAPVRVESNDDFGFGSTKTHSDELLENISTEQMLKVNDQHYTSISKEYVFCTSRLNKVQTSKLRQLCDQCKGNIKSEFNANVTHLIINLTNGRVPHTLKYLLAIANRSWVVIYDWVDECIEAGRLLSEERFETSNFPQCDPGPRRSRLAKSNLFEGFKFFFSTDFYKNMGFKFQEVNTLLTTLGAEVVQSLDNEDGELIIIGDLTANVADYLYWLTEKNWISVTFTWLIDCILEYKLVPFGTSHLCVDVSDQDLRTACVPEPMLPCISLYLTQRLHGL